MRVSLYKIFRIVMLNRRILRIKAFKVLYSNMLAGNGSLVEAQVQLEQSCEAVRDLYIYMMGIISPLTRLARERIEIAKTKFNPTEEEKHPNMKFADNALARIMDEDPDFQKLFEKKKFSWEQYDLFLKKVLNSVFTRKYYVDYMAAPESSLKADCRLFVKIFEEEFVDSEELAQILEDMSIWWNDDLAYALTWCCHSVEAIGKGARWELPALYQSDMKSGLDVESDKLFVTRLLQAAYTKYPELSALVYENVEGWDKDRLFLPDVALIVMGLAEAEAFPTIPLKVSINEYVEISKYYGTQKSRSFVNGLLDKLMQRLEADGKIRKEGKGLL